MIYHHLPLKFAPRFEIVSCYLEHDGRLLLLHRHKHKSEGNKWGVPAGKIEPGENELDAIYRELREETGQTLPPASLIYLTKVYVKYPDYHFIYHMFHARLDRKPEIILSETEHTAYKWVLPSDALKLELVRELDRCIKACCPISIEKRT